MMRNELTASPGTGGATEGMLRTELPISHSQSSSKEPGLKTSKEGKPTYPAIAHPTSLGPCCPPPPHAALGPCCSPPARQSAHTWSTRRGSRSRSCD